MEAKAKLDDDLRRQNWAELQEKAKDDPEFAEKLKVAQRVMDKYSETFERLADC